jgi:ABC-type multidrug transport system fused ATPase/permease subunit
MMSSEHSLYEKIDALEATVESIGLSVDEFRGAGADMEHVDKATTSIMLADQETSEYSNQILIRARDLLDSMSKRFKSIYKKIIIGNLIALFILLAGVKVGSVAEFNSSGTIFGLSISGLDPIEVVVGYWCYLFLLYVSLFWCVIMSQIYPMNIVRRTVLDWRRAKSLKDSIYQILRDLDGLGSGDLLDSVPPPDTNKKFTLDSLSRQFFSMLLDLLVNWFFALFLTYYVLNFTGPQIAKIFDLPLNPAIWVTVAFAIPGLGSLFTTLLCLNPLLVSKLIARDHDKNDLYRFKRL